MPRDDGKRVLIPGCGFGEDVTRFAKLGAIVSAFDLSPDVIEIAKARAARFGYEGSFGVMAAESTDYPGTSFDLIWSHNILHHVDIPTTLREFRRVLKPGGYLVGEEMYTHGAVERIRRRSRLINRMLYPRMVKFIYGDDDPYITEDERKIEHNELKLPTDLGCRISYYNCFIGRIVPDRSRITTQIDRAVMASIGPLGRLIAGKIVFSGRIAAWHH